MRGEADRARAILLTLQDWTSLEVAEAFGVTPDAVRHWRGWFSERGVDALRSTLAPDPSPAKGKQSLAVAEALLRRPLEDRTNWALPRLRAEVERRRSPASAANGCEHLGAALERAAEKGGFGWRRPGTA